MASLVSMKAPILPKRSRPQNPNTRCKPYALVETVDIDEYEVIHRPSHREEFDIFQLMGEEKEDVIKLAPAAFRIAAEYARHCHEWGSFRVSYTRRNGAIGSG